MSNNQLSAIFIVAVAAIIIVGIVCATIGGIR